MTVIFEGKFFDYRTFRWCSIANGKSVTAEINRSSLMTSALKICLFSGDRGQERAMAVNEATSSRRNERITAANAFSAQHHCRFRGKRRQWKTHGDENKKKKKKIVLIH
jgi:hypothetical protein